ncbi:MAG: hypothetical protein WAN71_00400 [Mycobacterium sp.]|uniref:hypothetical protein n=1 Tax=Mycobacterium sp. TaxID=1785 RepID=UPI003BB156FC
MASPLSTQRLQVSDEGLRLEASPCQSLAGKLAGNREPTSVGSSGLASVAAINTAQADVAAANIRCTFRVQATAGKLSAAAAGYTENEVSSAAQVQVLDIPTVC